MRTRLATIGCFLAIALTASGIRAQDFVWAKRLGGANQDQGYSVAVDSSGNVYSTGHFEGTADFDPGPGTYDLTSAGFQDIFVSKLDANGNFVWAKRLGGWNYDYGESIAVDGAGNVYTTGIFDGTVDFDPGPGTHNLTGVSDIFISKLDTNGSFVWARRMGGPSPDYGYSIVVDSAGRVYTTGDFRATADFDPDPGITYNLTSAGETDIFVSKLDANGNFVWARSLGGTSADDGYSIAVDGAGNVHATGIFQGTADFDPGPGTINLTSAGGRDIFVSTLDASGNFVWAKRMGGTGYDIGISIAVDTSGAVGIAGFFEGTADFGPWNLTSAGGQDIFVSKLDASAGFVWAKRLGGYGGDWGNSIALDGAGNVYTTGRFEGTVDFDPDPSVTYNLASAGYQDIFVSKLDANGGFVWAVRMGGALSDVGDAIAVDGAGNVHTTGIFQGTADFDPDPSVASSLMSVGGQDVFVSKLSQCSSFVDTSAYGRLLFPPLCTRDASTLTQDVYDSLTLWRYRGSRDRCYLSSEGNRFGPLAVDDGVQVNGQDSGLGPYQYQPGVPPFRLRVPVTSNLVPEPPQEITSLVPTGKSSVLFDLLDTDRGIYGNTAVYLVRDCGIYMDKAPATRIHFLSHDDQWQNGIPIVLAPGFDVRYGLLSQLRADTNFSRIACLGRYADTPGTVGLADPAAGDGYYFLAKEWSVPPGGGCFGQDYGDANVTPDPRDSLDAMLECP